MRVLLGPWSLDGQYKPPYGRIGRWNVDPAWRWAWEGLKFLLPLSEGAGNPRDAITGVLVTTFAGSATWSNHRVGLAMDDPRQDLIAVSSFVLQQPATVFAVIRLDSITGAVQVLVRSSPNVFVLRIQATGVVQFRDNSVALVTSPSALATGVWYALVASVDATESRLVVNSLETADFQSAVGATSAASNTVTERNIGHDGSGASVLDGSMALAGGIGGVAWSMAQMQTWAANPFGMLRPRRRLWFPSAAAEVTTTTDINKAGEYRILIADQQQVKSGQYALQPTFDIVKSAIYRILQTFDVTKLGEYRVFIAGQQQTKSGEYRVIIANQDQTKAGEYRIVKVFDINKLGQYVLQPTFDIVKSGMYRVGQTADVVKLGEYRMLMANQDITKSGVYRVKLVFDIAKGGEYRLILANQEMAKAGEYRLLMAANDILKSAIYRVFTTADVIKGGTYRAIISDNDFILVGQSRVRLMQSPTKFGRYTLVGEAIVRLNLPLDEETHVSGDVETLRLTLSLQEA